MTELLKQQEYYELPETKRLIAMRRKDIVDARIRLTVDLSLNQEQRDTLWMLIDRREWFLKMVAKDFISEMEQIDRELEMELAR